MKDVILEVENLSIGFAGEDGPVAITDRVSFEVRAGEILGLAGESGSGKTITALALLRLLPVPDGLILEGSIRFKGKDVLALDSEALRDLRGNDIAMIFQEPSSALNPLMTVEKQLKEVFDYHIYSGNQDARIRSLLKRVGFPDPDRILGSYPHELSGGMLQRVMIALALLLEPSIIIADEPTTALDVTVQAQIMELLVEQHRRESAAVILITHNLGLMAQYADRLAIMYAGRIVESAPIEAFLKNPKHPYTRGLIEALPKIDGVNRRLKPIDGQVPQPRHFPAGCRFAPRCAQRFDPCDAQPALKNLEGDHSVACFLHHDAEVTDGARR